jgi:hypothetical protein
MSQSIPQPSGNEPEGNRSSGKTCPSSSCREGALLLGVMTSSGRLAYVNPPAPVDAAFVARASAQDRPEQRFRFAGACIEGGCPQWTGDGCGVADMAADAAGSVAREGSRSLPRCSIRASCRWFSQRGAAACAVCPLIVADRGGTETYQSIRAQAARE